MKFTIRKANVNDASAISQLIHTVASQYVKDDFLTEIGKVKFFNATSKCSITDYIGGDYHYWVAENENEIKGVIAIRENKHIFHLFVYPDAHGKGIATTLWEKASQHALNEGNPGRFTVFSSSYAKTLYHKWGFHETRPFTIKNGIRSIPMQLELAKPLTQNMAS